MAFDRPGGRGVGPLQHPAQLGHGVADDGLELAKLNALRVGFCVGVGVAGGQVQLQLRGFCGARRRAALQTLACQRGFQVDGRIARRIEIAAGQRQWATQLNRRGAAVEQGGLQIGQRHVQLPALRRVAAGATERARRFLASAHNGQQVLNVQRAGLVGQRAHFKLQLAQRQLAFIPQPGRVVVQLQLKAGGLVESAAGDECFAGQ